MSTGYKNDNKKAEGRGANHINGASLGDVPRLGAIDMKQREIIQEGGEMEEESILKGICWDCGEEAMLNPVEDSRGRAWVCDECLKEQ